MRSIRCVFHGRCLKHNTRITVVVLPCGHAADDLGSIAAEPLGLLDTRRCPVAKLSTTNWAGVLARRASTRRTALSRLWAQSHQIKAPSASILKISNGGTMTHDLTQKSLSLDVSRETPMCAETL